MKRLLILLSSFCLVLKVSAQQPSWEEIEIKENIKLQQCVIDSLGFLWGLSSDGLYKYDGYDFILAFSPDSTDEKLLTLSQDEDHMLIMGSSIGKLIQYDPYRNSPLYEKVFLDSLPITKINCTDLMQNCVAISYGNGVKWQWNDESHFVSQRDQLMSNEVYDLVRREKEILIASDQGIQVISLTDAQPTLVDFAQKKELLDVIVTDLTDTEQGLWVSYFADSLTHIAGGSTEHYRFPEIGRIEETTYYNGSLFIASENGLFELMEGDLVKKYPSDGNMAVKDFTFDRQGNIWLINGKRKLFRASLSFQSYEINFPQIQAVQEAAGELWIGNKEGLFKIKNQRLNKILENNITCLFYEHSYLWVGTYSDGLFVLNASGEVIKNVKQWEGYSEQSVLSMLITENDLYVCSLTGVVKIPIKISNNGIELGQFSSLNPLIGEGYYYQILEDGDRIILATDGEGIHILENENLIEINAFNDGSKIGSVYSMAKDQEGRLWFSTANNGLGYLDQNIAYTRAQEKNNSDHYSSIATLSDGNLIMIRSASIDILDPSSKQILYFEKEVGISDEPPFLNAIDVSQSKAIFSHNDLVYQYTSPEKLKTAPEILINSVLANLDTLEDKDRLKQEQNNIQFNYTGSWLSNPAKLTYQYRLEGFDDEWRTTKDRSVSYPKLEPGQYMFKVRASVDEDFESDQEKSFRFTIGRYFYNTWWFWALVFVLLSFLLTRWRDAKRKRLLEQVEIEKKHVETQLSNLKSQLNPHFLFNSFNTLMGLIEEDQERSLSFVEKLTDFYRLVLEQGKNQLISIKEEMNLVNLFVDLLNERFEHSLVINLPSLEENILIPPLTLQLLIENAVKHNQIGGGKKLTIDLFKEGQYLVVRNNLSPKKFHAKSTGSGLNNIKKRYLLLNSKPIQIQKTDEYFMVRLPLIQAE